MFQFMSFPDDIDDEDVDDLGLEDFLSKDRNSGRLRMPFVRKMLNSQESGCDKELKKGIPTTPIKCRSQHRQRHPLQPATRAGKCH